ncbi:hypothetical protein Q9L58_003781 [Maublancomyces gigas]|uniref:Metallo-beta-lactamase domain-containing protein n=1 Tax=Discina gigas TaxID=1032678 RepID=A0ABR3GN02_9PEZI
MRLSLLSAASAFFTTALSHHGHFIRSDDAPQYAPVPATAIGPVIPSTGYLVQSFGGGAYVVLDGSYQSLFFVSTKGVIVVDCPPTLGHNLLYAIGNTTDIPVTHFVYSHSHGDHVGGASLFNNGKVIYIAHEDTKSRLSETPDAKRPLPSVTFKDNKTLSVGNQTLELAYKGPNHEPGNIFIYAPKQKVLALIDVVFPGWVPFAELAVSEDIPGWIHAHDLILEYDFVHYVGGHLSRTGVRQDVLVQKEYIQDLMDNCKEAITNSTMSINDIVGPTVQKNPGNGWATFKTYLTYVANECSEKTNKKWLGRLGAADVFGYDNAFKMVEVLRLDYSFLGPFGVV